MRLGALDIIQGLTGSPVGLNRLKSQLDALIAALLRLVPVPQPQVLTPLHACVGKPGLAECTHVRRYLYTAPSISAAASVEFVWLTFAYTCSIHARPGLWHANNLHAERCGLLFSFRLGPVMGASCPHHVEFERS